MNNIDLTKQVRTANEEENQVTNKNQNKNGLKGNICINGQLVEDLNALVEKIKTIFPRLTFGSKDNLLRSFYIR